MLVNVNYRGIVVKGLDDLEFRTTPPHMSVLKCQLDDIGLVKVVTFRNGKCRIMGCRKGLGAHSILITTVEGRMTLKIQILSIMSATATISLNNSINLRKLGDFCRLKSMKFMYEPEIFPALRISHYNPLCVNVFGSGKCVVLGIRSLPIVEDLCFTILTLINSSGAIELS